MTTAETSLMPMDTTATSSSSSHPFARSTSLLTPIHDSGDSDSDGFLSEDDRPLNTTTTTAALRKARSVPAFKHNLPFDHTSSAAYSYAPDLRFTATSRPSQDDRRTTFESEIWLDSNEGMGMSKAFAREVGVNGWTFVGEGRKAGAYVVYDCAIRTKEGTMIHLHKRYSAFEALRESLMVNLPRSLSSHVPPLPPKSALARFRPAFLNKRRIRLERWLAAVLLHPDLGGTAVVRSWVME